MTKEYQLIILAKQMAEGNVIEMIRKEKENAQACRSDG